MKNIPTAKEFLNRDESGVYNEVDIIQAMDAYAKLHVQRIKDFLNAEICERREYTASRMCEEVLKFIQDSEKLDKFLGGAYGEIYQSDALAKLKERVEQRKEFKKRKENMGKIDKNSKFYKAPTLQERLQDIKYFFLFWRGRKRGIIFTRNIELDDFRYIFFPKGFEKYGYLGVHLWHEEGDYFNALYPLVLAMDHDAKPKLCPRWFLRFLHVFGSDRSIVRVRNWTLHNLLRKLTKGIAFVDWKTKWHSYDLRISIHAPMHLQNLADDIEQGFYSRGAQEELVAKIKQLDPNAGIIWGSIEKLKKQLENLENKQS